MMKSLAVAMALGMAFATAAPQGVRADGDSPKLDCSKKANKDKPGCKNHAPENDELYQAAYWAARDGAYAKARAMLLLAPVPEDSRILNLMGYTTRKMGDVETALGYYGQALAANPDYTVAREYRGEAYLQMGDLASAKAELSEIASRCGTACAEYAHLAGHIAGYEASRAEAPVAGTKSGG